MPFKGLGPKPPQHPNGWYAYDAKGRILRSKHGLVVVPYRMHKGYWDCVVVVGDKTYPRGGYDICVFDEELLTAEELTATTAQVKRPGEQCAPHCPTSWYDPCECGAVDRNKAKQEGNASA